MTRTHTGETDRNVVDEVRAAAEAGLAEAQSKVGYFLRIGSGVPADPRAAIPWFRKALRGGYAKAAYNLGEMYRLGVRVPYRPRRAWFFYSKAVEMGRFFRAGVAGREDLAEAEEQALSFYRPGEAESLRVLFALRREGRASTSSARSGRAKTRSPFAREMHQ